MVQIGQVINLNRGMLLISRSVAQIKRFWIFKPVLQGIHVTALGPFHTGASVEQNPLAQGDLSTDPADDRSVSAPLCRADTVPFYFMGQSDGNKPPVCFYSIRFISHMGNRTAMESGGGGWGHVSSDIHRNKEETGGSDQVHLKN